MDPSKLPPWPIIMLNQKHIGHYADAASIAVWAANYLQTLEFEVAHMWPLRFTLVDLLVIFLRYVAPIQLIVSFFLGPSTPWASPKLCHQQFLAFIGISFVGVRCAEALLFIRTYAIVGKTVRWKWYLIFHFLVITAIPIYIVAKDQTEVIFFQPPGPFLGCGLPMKIDPTKPNLIPVVWGMVMGNEIAMMIVALYKGYTTYRHSHSPIVETLYKNGAFYLLAISAVTATNIGVALTLPDKAFFMSTLQHTLHTIFASNMILTVREQGGSQDRTLPQSGPAHSQRRLNRSSMYRVDGKGTTPSILAKFKMASSPPQPPPSFGLSYVSTDAGKSAWQA